MRCITKKEYYMIANALRKVWGWSQNKKSARAKVQIMPKIFRCQGCEAIIVHPDAQEKHVKTLVNNLYPEEQWFIEKTHVDHIKPCGTPLKLEEFIDNLFVNSGGLQILCTSCHYIKTQVDKTLEDEEE